MFPRWAGYFNFWVALLSAPACAIYWFKDGPMAWDGVFSIWFFVMGALMYQAIGRQAADEPADAGVATADLDARIAAAVAREVASAKPGT